MSTRASGLLLFTILFAARPPAAFAQSPTGAIAGTVADQTGAALPGATVVIKRVETGTTRTLVTDSRGRYHAPELEPGGYEVAAELQGFQTSVHRGLQLALGQELTVNLVLTLGQLSEQVVVTAASPLVETTQSGLTGVVDNRQIRDLPLNGRDFSQLTLLNPGVIAVPTAGRQLQRGMGTQISIAGARPNQISYLLDGTDISDQGGQSPGSAAGGLLGVDTVREFQVLTNNYSAEYGRSAGGVVSAVTRSGTNVLHGSGFEFFRNDALDAKNYFDPPDKPIPSFTRNQFGFTLGGPIRRNRTFFFGSYEGLRQDKGLSIVNSVPSRATRNRPDMSPVTRPYILLYPEPNGPQTGPSGLYFTTVNEPTRENYLVGKVDHAFTDKLSGSVRYTFDDASDITPRDVPLFSNKAHNRSQYLSLEAKDIFSSHLLNVVRFAYNRTFQETVNVDTISINPSMLFIPGTQFGSLGVTGLSTLGTDTLAPLTVAYNTFPLVDNLTWTSGRHTLKTGFSWTRWYNNQNALFTYGGSYTFTSIEDLVQNRPNNFEAMLPGTTADRYWRQNLFGLYVQDDIAASSRLTLNLGLRYEFITVPHEKYGRVSNFRDLQGATPTVGDPLFRNPSLKNVAPRVGFAWDVFGDGKTALRGGGGMFYEPILANFYRTLGNRTPPFFFQASLRNPPFPHALQQVRVPQQRLDLLDFNLKNPYLWQYNLTIQREVLPQTVVTVGYIGSRGIHQIRNLEYNEAVPTVLPDGRYFFPPGSTRRNRNFGSIRLRTTDGNSWFNAFVASVTKRFSAGLQLQGSYTYGKSLDEESISAGSNDLDNGFQPRYSFDRNDNKGLSDFDIKHNLVINYSYELPFGRDATGVLGALVKGWQISGLITARSGVPFTPVLGFDRARVLPRSGGAGQRPDPAPGYTGNVILGDPSRYFDPLAFALPQAGFFGTLGRNTLRGPGFASWDSAIVKNFGLAGGRKLQFRGEIFNALNHPNFGPPATTVFGSSGRVDNAGLITNTVGTSRQIQLALRLEF